MIDVQIKSEMIMHMALDTEHLIKRKHTIIVPGNLINGREFFSETKTKKRKGTYGNFGKAETFYYFESTPKGEEFKTGKELLESIGLTGTEE